MREIKIKRERNEEREKKRVRIREKQGVKSERDIEKYRGKKER